MTTLHRHAILPLPEDAIAQIKSSTAIVSLHGAVLALIENSIDARSTKIEVTVDFARGACTVEDNGLGIAPIEFREEGSLGKLYCTSKYKAHETLLGRHGTFLASLSSVSLLSIASRHYQHRSTNTVTLHHAKPIERHLPALSQHDIHDKHGTRVTVRNLFGNLPVRVKQRAKVLEQKTENDRLWDLFKTSVVGLLLSWGGSLSLRARNADNRVVFNFNTSDGNPITENLETGAPKLRSAHLTSLLQILTQANHISVDDWPSWIPASASTSSFSIKGAISLEPAPTKNVQFISIGIRPLSAETKYNEFYDEVNRLFKLSSFGALENDDLDSLEKVRQSNRRTEHQTYTNRQLRARKGVDRYPMFHLRISLRDNLDSTLREDRFIEDETNVQNILGVMNAMITQWLSAHHFRPIQPRQKRNKTGDASTPSAESSEVDNRSTSAPQSTNASGPSICATPSSLTKVIRPSTSSSLSRKRKRSNLVSRESNEEKSRHAFAKWSRIKTAKADFFVNAPALRKLESGTVASDQTQMESNENALTHRPGCTLFASFSTQSNNSGAVSAEVPQDDEHCRATNTVTATDGSEESILWTDPVTKKKHLLNARTGCAMSTVNQIHNLDTTQSTHVMPQDRSKISSRLPAKTTVEDAPWLDAVLKSWENPVFKTSEKRIGQLFAQDDNHDRMQHQCSTMDRNKTVNDLPITNTTKLSKEDLLSAEVIAQVDKKFILIKVDHSSALDSTQDIPTATLVLIDQHAADERIQVESLFQELCTPATSGYKSSLGHSTHIISQLLSKPLQFTISPQERTHFTTHAANFAAWGILFDALGPAILSENSNASAKPQHRLSVTALPRTIAERCKTDVHLLISFLRSTVWKYAGEPHLHPTSTPLSQDETASWVRKLATCPEGLIDMINSRACRSAIMFNDELDLEQCQRLVRRLADCVFPFMCAHGRPSMVPLGNVGGFRRAKDTRDGGKRGFVEAWKKWKS